MVGASQQKAMHQDRRKYHHHQQSVAIGQFQFPTPPPEQAGEHNGEERRDQGPGQIERAGDQRERGDQKVHRCRGVGRGAEGRVLEIMKSNGLQRMGPHALNTGHAGVAIRIHKIGGSAGKNLGGIPAAHRESEGQKYRQSGPRKKWSQKSHRVSGKRNILWFPEREVPISCGSPPKIREKTVVGHPASA